MKNYNAIISFFLHVLLVKLKEFQIRAKKYDIFSVYFVQSKWMVTENTCRVSYVFYLVWREIKKYAKIQLPIVNFQIS